MPLRSIAREPGVFAVSNLASRAMSAVTARSAVTSQFGLDAAHFGDYAERDQTRREHVLEIRAALGLRPLIRTMYREGAAWLMPRAASMDRGSESNPGDVIRVTSKRVRAGSDRRE
jgi:hypothetical protein